MMGRSSTRLAQLKEEEAELTELLSHYANAREEVTSASSNRIRRIEDLGLLKKRDEKRSQIAMLVTCPLTCPPKTVQF